VVRAGLAVRCRPSPHCCRNRYRNWLYTTLVGALWTSVYVPYVLAFQDSPGL